MKTADWDTIFEWIVSSWEEVKSSTILNGFRDSFGEHEDILEIEKNEMDVDEFHQNITDVPELIDLLSDLTFLIDENCYGFEV